MFALAARAEELRPLPPLLHTVSDEAGALSVDQGRALSRSAEDIFDRTGVRVIIVIAETTRPEEIEDYTERLGQRWKRERDLVPERSIFVVLSVRDREFQVMPGRGLEFVDRELKKPEAYAGLSPLFRQGRYFDALMTVNQRLLEIVLKQKSRS
ncbi:MAG TPA: TPM domain-containing protein [Hyphomicrobiaceae bacterium]